jgi:hypothetical protein
MDIQRVVFYQFSPHTAGSDIHVASVLSFETKSACCYEYFFMNGRKLFYE